MSSSVQTIIDIRNPSYTELRKFPKEDLIYALIEIKKSYSSEAIRLKEIDLEMQKMNHVLEIKKLEVDVSKRMLEYSNYQENKYGPMAASQVSAAVSNVMGVPVPFSKELKEATELEQRVDNAIAKGFRWNIQNKRPELNSTVLRKIETWEKSLELGKNSNPEDYVSTPYSDIISSNGGSEAFIVGLCETMEERFGIKPPSKYLKTRFKRNIAKLFSTEIPNAPALTSDDHASELVKRFWGTGLSKDDTNDLVAKLSQRIDNIGGLENLTPRNLKGLSTVDLLPVAVSFPEELHPQDRLKSLCWSDQYDGEVRSVIDTYRDEVEV
jgi:hypothetical protein